MGLYGVILYLHIGQIAIFYIGISAAVKENDVFPDDFAFGVATAAYQIEGGWNAGGKGESIWDRYIHMMQNMDINFLKDGDVTGDVACDSYNKYEIDVALMKHLGVQFYRFSIAWTRIISTPPNSTKINQEGLNYYNNLINLLVENGIEPMVTLFHGDLPQSLEDAGGFTNPIIIEEYVRYAKVLFDNFGDRVKMWLTFNEPKVFCLYGYGSMFVAPGRDMPGIGDYLCSYYVLKAHAEVYHLYNNIYKPKYNGKVALLLEAQWYEPYDNNNVEMTEIVKQFEIGWFGHPIYSKEGDFPEIMKRRVADQSKSEGYSKSRLPEFTKEEIERIRGTSDFIAVNHYTSQLVKKIEHKSGRPSFHKDMGADVFHHKDWPSFASCYKKVAEWGLPKILKWLKNNYGDLDIYITENGFADFGELEDYERIHYIYLYLKETLKSIHEDKIKVKGYAYWTLLDDVEFHFGTSLKFGLYHTNFTDPKFTRTPKASVEYYKNLIVNRNIYDVLPCLPEKEDITSYFKTSYKRGKYDDCVSLFLPPGAKP